MVGARAFCNAAIGGGFRFVNRRPHLGAREPASCTPLPVVTARLSLSVPPPIDPAVKLKKSSEPKRASLRIFVRRGALRRFDKLKADSTDLPVSIEWDRRAPSGERPEGAPVERRGEPAFTWKAADFVLVEGGEGHESQVAGPAKRGRRKP